MNKNHYSNFRRQSSRDSIERRMDQWVETGRQLVDGVAGNRPGQRKKDNRSGLNDMGRWVGEKIDWLFEDEDDWNESREAFDAIQEKTDLQKRPLTAVSLRVSKVLASSSHIEEENNLSDEWPDESSFKIDRWEREPSLKREENVIQNSSDYPHVENNNLRPLPRSSRIRN